jgi:hypothetical protein
LAKSRSTRKSQRSTGIYTAFQAIVWDALRQVGVNDGIDGCGRKDRRHHLQRIPAADAG